MLNAQLDSTVLDTPLIELVTNVADLSARKRILDCWSTVRNIVNLPDIVIQQRADLNNEQLAQLDQALASVGVTRHGFAGYQDLKLSPRMLAIAQADPYRFTELGQLAVLHTSVLMERFGCTVRDVWIIRDAANYQGYGLLVD